MSINAVRRPLLLLGAACLCAFATAATQTGQTMRSVELKSEPSADATSVATLAEKTAVEVLQRKGAWYQVKSATGTGWVRMLAIRSEGGDAKPSGGGGFSALRNMVGTGSSGTAVATGVRGLSEEDLKNAQPNPAELAAMQALAASPEDARKFAGQAKLSVSTVAYLPAPAARGKGAAK